MTSSGELDLRAELDEILFGFQSGVRHGYPVVLRRMRRDSNQKPVPCSCQNSFTKEPDPDCSYCLGEAYIWDEEWAWTYSMYSGVDAGLAGRLRYLPPGKIRVDYKIFFFRYDSPIRYGDKIVEMKLDSEGQLVVPYVREVIYAPATIVKYRSDNARIEYIQVFCKEEDALRMDEF